MENIKKVKIGRLCSLKALISNQPCLISKLIENLSAY